MAVTIGTFIYLIISFVIFIKNKKDITKLFTAFFIFFIISKLFLNIGYFVKIGTFEFLYDEFLTLILLVLSILILRKHKVSQRSIALGAIFFVCIASSSLFNVLFHYGEIGISYQESWDNYFLGRDSFVALGPTTSTILHAIRILLFVIIVQAYMLIFNPKDFMKLLKHVFRVAVVAIPLLLLEYVFKRILISPALNNIYENVFGVSAGTYTGLGAYLNGVYALNFLYKEQSHLANYFLFVSIILLIGFMLTNKKRYFIVATLVAFSTLLSRAFTSYLTCGFYLLFMLYLFFKKYRFVRKLIPVLLIAGLVAFIIIMKKTSYAERISNSVAIIFHFDPNYTYEFTSENVRFYSIMYNLLMFKRHFLFGVGLGTSYSMGGLSSALVSIGIVGFILYWVFLNSIFKHSLKKSIPIFPFLAYNLLQFFIGGIDYYYMPPMIIIFVGCYLVNKYVTANVKQKVVIKRIVKTTVVEEA